MCRTNGCPGLVRTRETHGWCPACWPAKRERYERLEAERRATEYKRDPRGTKAGDPRNTVRWKRVRALYLGSHPVCEECGRTEATQVHHLAGVMQGGAVFDEGNLRAVCTSCHARLEAAARS